MSISLYPVDKLHYVIVLIFFFLSFGCVKNQQSNIETFSVNNAKTELIAFGSYPDYYYNLANELNNSGRIDQAIEAYNNCITESQSQTFIEDAMYNLSMLYFETNEATMGYSLIDSLIRREYTWLNWYKNSNHPFATTPEYTNRLQKIDSLSQLRDHPQYCKFHYQDVSHFINAFQKSNSDWSNSPSYFYDYYFSKASKALFYYQKFKIQSSSHQFAYRVEDKKNYFESILPNLRKLKSQETTIRDYLEKFEQLYPPAKFPDIYYSVGCFNAGGTSSPFGLIIGTEMHSKTDSSDLTNFNNWERNVVRDFSNLPLIIIHELVHIQQHNNYENLLGNSIYEGAADFVSELICGEHINKHVHEWANEHEEEVWAAFKNEMYSKQTNNWIGNADNAKDKPADLGYYVGYKICESYYNSKADKLKAVSDILSISDWNNFYLKSGYMQ